MVFDVLHHHRNADTGEAYPAQETISSMLDISRRTVHLSVTGQSGRFSLDGVDASEYTIQ